MIKRYNLWIETPKIGGWSKRNYVIFDRWYKRSWTGWLSRNSDARKVIGRDRYDQASVQYYKIFDEPHHDHAPQEYTQVVRYWFDNDGRCVIRIGDEVRQVEGSIRRGSLHVAFAHWHSLGLLPVEVAFMSEPHEFPRAPIKIHRKLRMRP